MATLLFSLAACGGSDVSEDASAPPAVDLTTKPSPEPPAVPLSAEYAEILRSGTYYYVLALDAEGSSQTVVSAAKDGAYYTSTETPEDRNALLFKDGKGYASRKQTGEVKEVDPAETGQSIPVYAALTFKDTAEADGKTTDAYTCQTMDGGQGEVLFVFEDGKLAEMTTPELSVAGTQPVSDFSAEPPAELFEIPEAPQSGVSPYAWLGYAALPQNRYYDILSTGVFYREYVSHIAGYSVPSVEATDGENTYRFDGSTVMLNLNGIVYSLNANIKRYIEKDMTEAHRSALAKQNENRAHGVDTTGKVFTGTGSEPVPLLSDSASYTYYEFTTEQMGAAMRERIYFKDGDVYAIHARITNNGASTELTERITLVSAEPDPALFALPEDFAEYEPIG